jgi:TPR repeat protein
MTDDAERNARQAAASGDPEAMFALSVVLEQAGRRIRSVKWLQRAARAGHPAANNKLGMLAARLSRGSRGAALSSRHRVRRHRRAEQPGVPPRQPGPPRGSRTLVPAGHRRRKPIRAGQSGAPPPADWAASRGRGPATPGGRHRQPRRPVQPGHALHESSRLDEAERVYRQAADAGDIESLHNLGALLDETGRPDQAEQCLRTAADAGNLPAVSALGLLLERTGRAEEAEQLLRSAAASGDRHAMHNLGYVLEQMGRSTEASRWQRRAGTPPSSTGTGLGRRGYIYHPPPGHSATQPDDAS